MSAEVVEMFYEGETPWHNLGNKIEGNISPGEALVKAGADYIIATSPLKSDIVIRKRGVADVIKKDAVVNGVSIYREDTGEIFGTSGPVYQPYQNEDMVEWFRPFIESGDAHFHTGGVLCGGKRTWFLCKLDKDNSVIVEDDEIAKFLLLSNSHDGKVAVRIGFTPVRVVCANTLAYAHSSEFSNLIRVRHTNNTKANLEAFRDAVNIANETFEMTAEQYRWLASRQCNINDMEKYIKIVLGADKKEELPTRTKNTITQIMDLAINGRGNSNPKVVGTWYGAYNGVNEWLNYEKGRNENNRLDSLWFGQNYNVNQNALEVALSLAS